MAGSGGSFQHDDALEAGREGRRWEKMTWDEMNQAVSNAEGTMRLVDSMITRMVSMIIGRLRKCDNRYHLVRLKRELQRFNANTKQWMD
jgi:hypothetical protein